MLRHLVGRTFGRGIPEQQGIPRTSRESQTSAGELSLAALIVAVEINQHGQDPLVVARRERIQVRMILLSGRITQDLQRLSCKDVGFARRCDPPVESMNYEVFGHPREHGAFGRSDRVRTQLPG